VNRSTVMSLVVTGASLLVTTVALATAPEPVYQTAQDCATRLSHSPLATPDRQFLERCVSAFSDPTTLSGTSPISPPPTTPPASVPPGTTTRPVTMPPPTTSPPIPSQFPTPGTTGVPGGWVPVSTRTTDLRVTTPGTLVQDIRIVNANLIIDANNVTVRRVEIQGGWIDNAPNHICRTGTLIEDASLIRAAGPTSGDHPSIQHGGYTARRVEINGLSEGFRIGGKSAFGCGTTTIQDSFARVVAPDTCGDWHGDGLQGYDGPALVARNNTLELVERDGCGGTAPFFYPSNQGNTSVTVDRLLVSGGGYSFRLGTPGTVTGLKIDQNWFYGPINVRCSVITTWEARIVTMDSNYNITDVGPRSCNTEAGS
jgi:hypothetical protein